MLIVRRLEWIDKGRFDCTVWINACMPSCYVVHFACCLLLVARCLLPVAGCVLRAARRGKWKVSGGQISLTRAIQCAAFYFHWRQSKRQSGCGNSACVWATRVCARVRRRWCQARQLTWSVTGVFAIGDAVAMFAQVGSGGLVVALRRGAWLYRRAGFVGNCAHACARRGS